MATISETLAIAVQHPSSGSATSCRAVSRQILQVKPNQADAWHLLGCIAHQVGRHEVAVEYVGRAIQINATNATFYATLGNAHPRWQRNADAVASYRRALKLQPDMADVHINLGNALKSQGKLDEAIACYRRVLELEPNFAGRTTTWATRCKPRGSWTKRSLAITGHWN